jgi:hypothetical protein
VLTPPPIAAAKLLGTTGPSGWSLKFAARMVTEPVGGGVVVDELGLLVLVDVVLLVDDVLDFVVLVADVVEVALLVDDVVDVEDGAELVVGVDDVGVDDVGVGVLVVVVGADDAVDAGEVELLVGLTGFVRTGPERVGAARSGAISPSSMATGRLFSGRASALPP